MRLSTNKRVFGIAFFIVIVCNVALSQNVEIVPKPIDDHQIEILVKNNTDQGQSVELDCELKRMKASADLPKTMYLSAGEEAVFVTLKPVDIYKSYSYGTSIRYVQGDITATHDDGYVYSLPYPKAKTYKVDQGYFGNKTHQNQHALDFHMDVGEEITAIRGGIVTKVVEGNDRGCPDESCNSFNNYILITHSDGSIADYSHLQKKGAKVKVGDKVKPGDIVGISGATGWASGPHLHLEVYTMTWTGQKTVPAKYYLDSENMGIPKEGVSYTQSQN
ncbi:MAG: M23 family metallopeptidase [Cyclobacteriaceae bacterium]